MSLSRTAYNEGGGRPGDNFIKSIIDKSDKAVFALRRYEDASLRYTGIESHEGLSHYGLYDTVVAKE